MNLLVLSILLLLHPIHVTLTSIEYNSNSEEVKVFVRIYYDDFLDDYRLFDGGEDVKETTDGYVFPSEDLFRYIDDRLRLEIGSEKLRGELINMSLQDNEMEVNLVYETVNGSELKVYVGFLSELYDDQANMTIVKINDKEEGVGFSSDYKEKSFSLN